MAHILACVQATARKNEWPLDKTVIVTEVTKKQPDQIDGPSRDGAFVHGLTLEVNRLALSLVSGAAAAFAGKAAYKRLESGSTSREAHQRYSCRLSEMKVSYLVESSFSHNAWTFITAACLYSGPKPLYWLLEPKP